MKHLSESIVYNSHSLDSWSSYHCVVFVDLQQSALHLLSTLLQGHYSIKTLPCNSNLQHQQHPYLFSTPLHSIIFQVVPNVSSPFHCYVVKPNSISLLLTSWVEFRLEVTSSKLASNNVSHSFLSLLQCKVHVTIITHTSNSMPNYHDNYFN